ncbi:hypothetical protein ACSBL2_03380 [Pedobacter sp. AW31-3R]
MKSLFKKGNRLPLPRSVPYLQGWRDVFDQHTEVEKFAFICLNNR